MKAFIKTLVVSLQLMLTAALISAGYGFFRGAPFAYVFNVNFLLGAIIICIALVRMFLPVRIKSDKLTDHTTIGQRYAEQHGQKQEKAYEYLFLGISVIIITGLLQLLLSVLIA